MSSIYIDLATKSVFSDEKGKSFKVYRGSFLNASDLQWILQSISYYQGFKKPKKFIATIQKFERETKQECIY